MNIQTRDRSSCWREGVNFFDWLVQIIYVHTGDNSANTHFYFDLTKRFGCINYHSSVTKFFIYVIYNTESTVVFMNHQVWWPWLQKLLTKPISMSSGCNFLGGFQVLGYRKWVEKKPRNGKYGGCFFVPRLWFWVPGKLDAGAAASGDWFMVNTTCSHHRDSV
jgi:hypothetical protein